MEQRKGMPRRGKELKDAAEEVLKKVDYEKELRKEAAEAACGLPKVHIDPPFRPERER